MTAVDEESPAGSPSARTLAAHRRLAALGQRLEAFKTRAPRLIAFLRVVYYPFALALVGWFAYQATRKIDVADLHWWPLVGAYVAALVWWASLALGWSALVTDGFEGAPVAAWGRTPGARHPPRGVWGPVARAAAGHGRGGG